MVKNLGLDLMTEAWRALSYGRTKNSVILGTGLRNNQTTGELKTVSTLLVPSMATLGMMCRVITATTSLVLQVIKLSSILAISFR